MDGVSSVLVWVTRTNQHSRHLVTLRGPKNADSPGLRGVLLEHGLHGLELEEVLAHVGVQDHLDAERAELPELVPRHVGEDVAVVLLDRPVV